MDFLIGFRQSLRSVIKIYFWSLAILSIGAIFILFILGYGEMMIRNYLLPLQLATVILLIMIRALYINMWSLVYDEMKVYEEKKQPIFNRLFRFLIYTSLAWNVIMMVIFLEKYTEFHQVYYTIKIGIALLFIDLVCEAIQGTLTLVNGSTTEE
ncbi:hypothetical protein [Bacillus safensis]|uniref:hypothetical protein n=1 Tax=Bacillus safensis TaxID=561879 RepID=UPI002E1A58C4|nr:hypothetical protein [Bacillus safensis]